MSIDSHQFTLGMVGICCAALVVVVWLSHISVKRDLERRNDRRAAAAYAEQAHPDVWPPNPRPAKKRMGWEAGNYLFCLACKGIYNSGQVALSGTKCPQEACPGAASEMIPWNDLRRARQELPEVPLPGEVYRAATPNGELALVGDKDIAAAFSPTEIGAAGGIASHAQTNN